MEFSHIPVLLQPCLDGLNIDPAGIYLDGTAGGAGHSREIAKRLTTGRLISLDQDPDAVAVATHSNFSINRIFQFQYLNIVADRMRTYAEFKCQIADCILLSFVYPYNQLPTALIKRQSLSQNFSRIVSLHFFFIENFSLKMDWPPLLLAVPRF